MTETARDWLVVYLKGVAMGSVSAVPIDDPETCYDARTNLSFVEASSGRRSNSPRP